MRSISRTLGFTLLELLIALAVLSIALGIGVPSYKQTVARAQVAAAANDFIVLVQNARSQARRVRGRVIVCPTTNGTSCGGSNWNQAISGIDANRNNTINAGETILRRVTLNGRVTTSNFATLPLIFLSDGTARMGNPDNDGIENTSAIVVCVKSANYARVVNVGFSGAQTEIEHGSASDCT